MRSIAGQAQVTLLNLIESFATKEFQPLYMSRLLSEICTQPTYLIDGPAPDIVTEMICYLGLHPSTPLSLDGEYPLLIRFFQWKEYYCKKYVEKQTHLIDEVPVSWYVDHIFYNERNDHLGSKIEKYIIALMELTNDRPYSETRDMTTRINWMFRKACLYALLLDDSKLIVLTPKQREYFLKYVSWEQFKKRLNSIYQNNSLTITAPALSKKPIIFTKGSQNINPDISPEKTVKNNMKK
ncbi:MAG: hypothetical protein FJ161_01675 [Gammaproteobacteria bacterium]|nr:hypothetical protein [Gammaproteobacteria bacterium]